MKKSNNYKDINLNGIKRDTYDSRDYIFEDRFLVMDYQLPNEFNLLDKTPNASKQVGVGNCVSHACCTCRAMLEGNKDLDFSKAFLYYQARIFAGDTLYDRGVTIRNAMKALKKYGVCENTYMPNEKDYKTPPSIDALDNAKKYRVQTYLRINSLLGIKNWLIGKKQPVVFGLEANSDLRSIKVAKTGRLKVPKNNETSSMAHAGLIIGWHDSTPFEKFLSHFNKRYSPTGSLLIRNSWGSDWGILGGCYWLPYEWITSGHAFDFWICEK
jgi:C1A family cysteine protease